MLEENLGRFSFREWRQPISFASKGSAVLQVRATNNRGMTQPAEATWNPGGYQRQVIELRFLLDKSVLETADLMNRSEDAVKNLQRRALAAMQRALVPDGYPGRGGAECPPTELTTSSSGHSNAA